MAEFHIKGGRPLEGSIKVLGAKNHALKMIAASLLIDGETELSNVPDIEDVGRMLEIAEDLGAVVRKNGDQVRINASNIKKNSLHKRLSPNVRASILCIAPLLHRFEKGILPYPGGCAIGRRPIDLFLDAFRAFGAKVESKGDAIHISAKNLHSEKFVFTIVSHTGTEAIMLLACLVPGITKIINAAMEPEVEALADFLNSCGARIRGAGTSVIEIEGVKKLKPGKCRIIPDRIEAGTFTALAASTKSNLEIKNCDPKTLTVPLYILKKMGVPFEIGKDHININISKQLKAVNITTHEYPGFPTDLQAPFTVLMTQARGQSLIHETIFEGRLFYVDKLTRMGANILLCDPHRILITGPRKLKGTRLESPDIRAGMASIIAGLAARGTTVIDNIYQIDRGYEKIDERLRAVGAEIERIDN